MLKLLCKLTIPELKEAMRETKKGTHEQSKIIQEINRQELVAHEAKKAEGENP